MHAHSANQKQLYGNRFIEQYEWTRMCITVQIGEVGKFTDVQIAERGKQRIKRNLWAIKYPSYVGTNKWLVNLSRSTALPLQTSENYITPSCSKLLLVTQL